MSTDSLKRKLRGSEMPSIAVLALTNMNRDPELDVRFVLEGSVRKAGNRVRVTAQLIDAETGHHVWAD
jgi:TolB-like protein